MTEKTQTPAKVAVPIRSKKKSPAVAKPVKKRVGKKLPLKKFIWNEKRRHEFLVRLTDTANVRQSALQMNMAPWHAYAERRKNPAFAAAWHIAINQALDGLEAVLLDRVIHGLDKPLIYKGKCEGTYKHYSDALAMFMLRNRRPEAFAEVGSGVVDETADVRTQIEARLARLAAAKRDGESDGDGVTENRLGPEHLGE